MNDQNIQRRSSFIVGGIAVLLLGLVAVATPLMGQRTITVKVGEYQHVAGFRTAINTGSIVIQTRDPEIAVGLYNEGRVAFEVKGLAEGETMMKLKASAIGVGREVRPGQNPFQNVATYVETVRIVVVKTDLETLRKAATLKTPASPTLSSLLGAAFSNAGDDGKKWRNLRLYSGDDGVSTASIDTRAMRLRVSGDEAGEHTEITLTGEFMEPRGWRRVVSVIRVEVPGQRPSGPRTVDDARGRYGDLKAELDDLKNLSKGAKKRLLNKLNSLEQRVERMIRAEQEDDFDVTPNELANKAKRLEDLGKLLDQIAESRERVENSVEKDTDQKPGNDPPDTMPLAPKEPKPAKPGPVEDIGEIRWAHTADSLKLSDKVGKRITLRCPASPPGTGIRIIMGTGPFAGSSTICNSALYANRIGTSGGIVTLEIGPPLARYAGTTNWEDAPLYSKNGVQAYSGPSDMFPAASCSFSFID